MRHILEGSWFKSTITCLAFAGFLLIPWQLQAERGIELRSKDDLSHRSGKLGAYRALVIGINNYQDKKIPALKTAVNDARELAGLLQTRYGFKVDLLLDGQATRKEIIGKLRELTANSSVDQSVLIYYAGHGEIDKVFNDGWWVPADAKGGDSSTYLDNTMVQKAMKRMKAKHVLLVSDSCYSGTLFGEARSLPLLIDDKFYLNLYNEKSRWGMTSGNKTPVSDSGSEGHSIFAYQLLKALTKNEKPYITTQEIYSRIAPIIANNSQQQPLCSPVRDTGDQGGGFVFVATPSAAGIASDSSSYMTTVKQDADALRREKEALEREKQEFAGQKEALERQKALTAERERVAAERQRIEREQKALTAERERVAAERQRIERERQALARKQEKTVVAMDSRPSVSGSSEIGRDGPFIAYSNGTVLDTRTNLMWASRDNGSDIKWADAKRYCENYRGGGYSDWRMPTKDELEGLYDMGKNQRNEASSFYPLHLTELINLTSCCPWAVETRGSDAAYFYFGFDNRPWNLQSFVGNRALPVRSGR